MIVLCIKMYVENARSIVAINGVIVIIVCIGRESVQEIHLRVSTGLDGKVAVKVGVGYIL